MSLKNHAEEVLQILEQGFYNSESGIVNIADDVRNSIENSRLFFPNELANLTETYSSNELSNESMKCVEVVAGTTQQIAQELALHNKNLALLNFASARNPGGGFLNGAKAQEEDLCRCSSLYPSLLRHPTYYESNRQQSSLLYTDHMIYSPDVVFFKTRGTSEFLAEPFKTSVITAPAPNTGPYLEKSGDLEQLEQCFERRWQYVLTIAIHQHTDILLLGAWGCGAFQGDPKMAAASAMSAIRKFPNQLEKIVFAIPAKGKQSMRNFQSFRDVLVTG